LRKIRVKFLGLFEGSYESTPVVVAPNIPPCHSSQYFLTTKIRKERIVIAHTNENGESDIYEQEIRREIKNE
jgi:hypothetical protein